jgi:hypothetical protein
MRSRRAILTPFLARPTVGPAACEDQAASQLAQQQSAMIQTARCCCPIGGKSVALFQPKSRDETQEQLRFQAAIPNGPCYRSPIRILESCTSNLMTDWSWRSMCHLSQNRHGHRRQRLSRPNQLLLPRLHVRLRSLRQPFRRQPHLPCRHSHHRLSRWTLPLQPRSRCSRCHQRHCHRRLRRPRRRWPSFHPRRPHCRTILR